MRERMCVYVRMREIKRERERGESGRGRKRGIESEKERRERRRGGKNAFNFLAIKLRSIILETHHHIHNIYSKKSD